MYIRVTATIAFLIHLFIVEPTHAAAPELTRADAQKILAAQGYNDISVVALLQGMGGIGIGVFSNPNVSFVLYAYNYRNKKTKKDEPIAAEQSMYFDPIWAGSITESRREYFTSIRRPESRRYR